MGETTGISWTEATWNPWMGCTKVSAGCDHCYMFREQRQYGNDPEAIRRSKTKFDAPLKMQGSKLIFTCSWSDFFHIDADEWRDEAWDIIRRTPQHTYQILTKRPGRILRNLPDDWGDGYPNVWLGVSVESAAVMHRVKQLREVPAALRFISAEPLLGSLFTTASQAASGNGAPTTDGPAVSVLGAPEGTAQDDAQSGPEVSGTGGPLAPFDGFGWVIVGGESGAKADARPMHPAWAREIRDACLCPDCGGEGWVSYAAHHPSCNGLCQEYGCPVQGQAQCDPCGGHGTRVMFHMKQWGSWAPNETHPDGWFVLPDGSRCTPMYADAYDVDLSGAVRMHFAGAAPGSGGKFLDGVDWCQIPGRLTLA